MPPVLLKDGASRTLSDFFSPKELDTAVEAVKREEGTPTFSIFSAPEPFFPEHIHTELKRVVESRWVVFNGHLDDALANTKVSSLIASRMPQLEKDLELFQIALNQHDTTEKHIFSGTYFLRLSCIARLMRNWVDYEAFFRSAKPGIFNFNSARDLKAKHDPWLLGLTLLPSNLHLISYVIF